MNFTNSSFLFDSMKCQEKVCLDQIRTFLLDKCPAVKSLKSKLHDLLVGSKAAGTGILIREGMVNLPPEIYPALHEMLLSDIKWASEFAEGEGEELDSRFNDLVFIAPFSEVECSSSSSSSSSTAAESASGVILFDRFDDDILAQAASVSASASFFDPNYQNDHSACFSGSFALIWPLEKQHGSFWLG
jgi:hypothetical protein